MRIRIHQYYVRSTCAFMLSSVHPFLHPSPTGGQAPSGFALEAASKRRRQSDPALFGGKERHRQGGVGRGRTGGQGAPSVCTD